MTELAVTLAPLLFVGIDWGAVAHRVVVIDAAGKQVHDWTIEHSGAALADLADRLVSLVDGAASRCHVAIEVTRGPLVELLLERGLTVFAVNPKQSDRFRDRVMPSGAKDDRRDGFVLAGAVRTDAQHLRRLAPTDRRTVVLRAALRLRDELVGDNTRLINRLREQLWRYYAQAIELADGEFDSRWLWTLLEKAPTPSEGALLSRAVVSRVLRDHRVRKWTADEALAALRKPSLVVADGVAEAGATHVRSILPRLRVLDAQIREVERSIDQQLELWSKLDAGSEVETADATADSADEPPGAVRPNDAAILRSLPGVGPITLATMLAELREPLDRRDHAHLRLLMGVAPVTRRSGSAKLVMMRRTSNGLLRNAALNWSRNAVRHDLRCRTRFAELVARGKTKAHAHRIVVDHLLRVACAMLRAGTTYDAARVRHAAPAA
jgi:transposase